MMKSHSNLIKLKIQSVQLLTCLVFSLKADKDCDAGDVAKITVSSKDFDSVTLEAAKMVEEAVTYTVEDDDLPTIWAGKTTLMITTKQTHLKLLSKKTQATSLTHQEKLHSHSPGRNRGKLTLNLKVLQQGKFNMVNR